MKIDLHKITIRNVIADFKDSAEEGVTAYGGRSEEYIVLCKKEG